MGTVRLYWRTRARLRRERVELSQGPSQRGACGGGVYRAFCPQTGCPFSNEEVLLKPFWAMLQEEKEFGTVHAIEGIIN